MVFSRHSIYIDIRTQPFLDIRSNSPHRIHQSETESLIPNAFFFAQLRAYSFVIFPGSTSYYRVPRSEENEEGGTRGSEIETREMWDGERRREEGGDKRLGQKKEDGESGQERNAVLGGWSRDWGGFVVTGCSLEINTR